MISDSQLHISEELTEANEKIAKLEAEVRVYDGYCGTVSHELKTPIGNILAYADDLHTNYDVMSPTEIKQYLDMILIQSRRMNSIVDELLLLANVKMSTQVKISQVQMGPIVTHILEQLAPDIGSANAEIELPDKWHDAVGYSPWIERIWYNYLTNGLKYGGTPPQLTLGSEHDANGRIRFWIADRGPGLLPEQQATMFQPFPEISKQHQRSNGLGLSIVKQIAERLNGSVGVESTAGSGSVFYFTLPSIE